MSNIKSTRIHSNYFCHDEIVLKTVYFFTFHKCASTLFSSFILKNINGLDHVDYASQIYSGNISIDSRCFKKKGCIYGPIRLSVEKKGPVYELLVKPASSSKFIKNKIAIFFCEGSTRYFSIILLFFWIHSRI